MKNFYRNNKRNKRTITKKYGRDSVEIDLVKVNTINWKDAIKRSEYNNKIVDRIEFAISAGRRYSVNGNQLIYYTLMPSAPLIDCKYLRLLETIETIEKLEKMEVTETIERVSIIDAKDKDKVKSGMVEKKEIVRKVEKLKDNESIIKKKDVAFIRGCIFGKKDGDIPGICNLSNEKIAEKKCVGDKFQTSSLEFWIITKGFSQIDNKEEEFNILFINKNAITYINEPEFRRNDILKDRSLTNIYIGMRSGRIKYKSVPKPGNTLFHTLFSGEVYVEIETIKGKMLRGIIKGYELTPGGHPSLILYTEDNPGGSTIVPMYRIGTMLINKYQINDLLRRRTLEMTLKGHIVIPHPDTNLIIDYCKRDRMDKDQTIKLDGTLDPYNLDDHDLELADICNKIKWDETNNQHK